MSGRPMSRRWRWAAGTVCCAALAVGCGVPTDGIVTVEPADLPRALRTSTTTTTTTGRTASPDPESGDVRVYWISDKTLVPEAVTFETTPDVDRVVALLERGPSGERSPEVRSAVSQSEVVREVSRDDSSVTVELAKDFSELVGSDQVLALGQIVTTLTSVPGVRLVEFRRSGDPLDVPVADGSVVRRAVTRADYASLLP